MRFILLWNCISYLHPRMYLLQQNKIEVVAIICIQLSCFQTQLSSACTMESTCNHILSSHVITYFFVANPGFTKSLLFEVLLTRIFSNWVYIGIYFSFRWLIVICITLTYKAFSFIIIPAWKKFLDFCFSLSFLFSDCECSILAPDGVQWSLDGSLKKAHFSSLSVQG